MSFLKGALSALGGGGVFGSKKVRNMAGSALFGTPEERDQVSNLTPEQMEIQEQLQRAAQERGAGGSFGTAADYYRDLLSNDNLDIDAFSAPEMRRFREDILPSLAEQFAGMGAGGLSSSGFQNAAVGAGADLSERLAAIRSTLRQNAAQGLQGIGSQSLIPHAQWQTTQVATPGLLASVAPAVGSAIGTAVGGPIGGAIGNGLGNSFGNAISPKGTTSPYGQFNSQGPSFSSSLPNFNQRLR